MRPKVPLYLGYSADDLAHSPYAAFFRPAMEPLSESVRAALLNGAVAPELMPSLADAGELQSGTDWTFETAYTLCPDGEARVFVHTPMPGVTPAMWDWWFGWHGDEAQKYKLWHPQAHVHAAWDDGQGDLGHYVGRTSRVVEYVGSTRMALTICFVPPREMGLDEDQLKVAGEVAICARVALADGPVETGWLIHHLRPTADGCEMRSRFWLGGGNVRPKGLSGKIGRLLGGLAARFAPIKEQQASALLIHCAQEMRHLATILPKLNRTFFKSQS
ncbi:MAG: hypothetical protein RLZZ141_383 [Pseudomonadota bacterium]